MIHALANVPLSAEAKAVVAQAYCTGVALEVSTVINLGDGIVFNREFFRELVSAGWGEQLGQYIEIIETGGATHQEALRLVQSAVRSGIALFAVCNVGTGSKQRCYLSVHHALADEQTLSVVSNLVQLAHVGKLDLTLQEANQGRQAYYSYVERQRVIAKEDIVLKELRRKPIRLAESGRLAWSTQIKRVCLSRIIRIKDAHKLHVTAVLALLSDLGVVSEGDTACMSRCWRLPYESGAIGMMTGLIAMPIERIPNASTQLRTSLEASARHNSDAHKVLECCRASELFINGAAPRGIPAEQVISGTFPVGMDFRRISESEFRLEFEGRFCSEAAVNDLLNELVDILSD